MSLISGFFSFGGALKTPISPFSFVSSCLVATLPESRPLKSSAAKPTTWRMNRRAFVSVCADSVAPATSTRSAHGLLPGGPRLQLFPKR
jgi:hypothetical protein